MLSPIPDTLVSSSTVLNSPFFSRYSMIAKAFDSPIPDNVCNSSKVAVFKLTIDDVVLLVFVF